MVDNTKAAVDNGEVIRKNGRIQIVKKGRGGKADDVLMPTSPDFAVLGNTYDPEWGVQYKEIGRELYNKYGHKKYLSGDSISEKSKELNNKNMNSAFESLLQRQQQVNQMMGHDKQYKDADDTQYQQNAYGGTVPRYGLGGWMKKHPYKTVAGATGLAALAATTPWLFRKGSEKLQDLWEHRFDFVNRGEDAADIFKGNTVKDLEPQSEYNKDYESLLPEARDSASRGENVSILGRHLMRPGEEEDVREPLSDEVPINVDKRAHPRMKMRHRALSKDINPPVIGIERNVIASVPATATYISPEQDSMPPGSFGRDTGSRVTIRPDQFNEYLTHNIGSDILAEGGHFVQPEAYGGTVPRYWNGGLMWSNPLIDGGLALGGAGAAYGGGELRDQGEKENNATKKNIGRTLGALGIAMPLTGLVNHAGGYIKDRFVSPVDNPDVVPQHVKDLARLQQEVKNAHSMSSQDKMKYIDELRGLKSNFADNPQLLGTIENTIKGFGLPEAEPFSDVVRHTGNLAYGGQVPRYKDGYSPDTADPWNNGSAGQAPEEEAGSPYQQMMMQQQGRSARPGMMAGGIAAILDLLRNGDIEPEIHRPHFMTPVSNPYSSLIAEKILRHRPDIHRYKKEAKDTYENALNRIGKSSSAAFREMAIASAHEDYARASMEAEKASDEMNAKIDSDYASIMGSIGQHDADVRNSALQYNAQEQSRVDDLDNRSRAVANRFRQQRGISTLEDIKALTQLFMNEDEYSGGKYSGLVKKGIKMVGKKTNDAVHKANEVLNELNRKKAIRKSFHFEGGMPLG